MNRLLCACIGLPAHCLCHPVCHRSGAHWGNCMAHLPALAWGSLAPACNNLPLGAAGAHCTHAEACWVPSKGTMPAARKSCNAIPSLSPAGHPACKQYKAVLTGNCIKTSGCVETQLCSPFFGHPGPTTIRKCTGGFSKGAELLRCWNCTLIPCLGRLSMHCCLTVWSCVC